MAGVFFASGLASLVYQIAWQRMLTLHTGAGAVSITLVVSAWMLGLGLGALAGGHLACRVARPRRAYACVEAALAGVGLSSLPLAAGAGAWIAAVPPVQAFAAAFVCLLVPTALMGVTLPLLAVAAVQGTRRFAAGVSHLYLMNTIGAAAGAAVPVNEDWRPVSEYYLALRFR